VRRLRISEIYLLDQQRDARPRLKPEDLGDACVAIVWSSVSGAQSYTISRANGDTNFTPIGTVADPSFADMSLRPASAYSYKVTARLNGDDEGATSPVVTATTLAVPPRCDTPGTCSVPGSNR